MFPKAVVTVRPDERVFRGETVTLRCDIKWGGDTEWTYRWEIEGTSNNTVNQISAQEWTISSVDHVHGGKYSCTGQMGTQSSQRSDAVILTVSGEFVCLLIIISVNSFSLYNWSCFVQLKLRQQCECLHSRG